MARQYVMARGRGLFDASSRAVAAALLGLLGPLACGAGSAGSAGDDDVTEPSDAPGGSRAPRDEPPAEPEPSTEDDDEPPPNSEPSERDDAPDEMPAAPGANAGSSGSVPPAPAAAFAACARSEGSYGNDCAYVYVTMTQTSPERCVQLTIDSCGDSYTRQGLPVDTPLSWQLSSASIGASPDDCELGVFNPDSAIVVDASGEIRWEASAASGPLPTDIVVDVTLQPSSTADDTSSVDVVTPEPLNPVRCED